MIGNSVLIFNWYSVGVKPDGSHSQDCQISKLKNSLRDVVVNVKKQIAPWGSTAAEEGLLNGHSTGRH